MQLACDSGGALARILLTAASPPGQAVEPAQQHRPASAKDEPIATSFDPDSVRWNTHSRVVPPVEPAAGAGVQQWRAPPVPELSGGLTRVCDMRA